MSKIRDESGWKRSGKHLYHFHFLFAGRKRKRDTSETETSEIKSGYENDTIRTEICQKRMGTDNLSR